MRSAAAPAGLAAALAAALAACAPALRAPAPLPAPGPGTRTADELLEDAGAAWARRADPAQARAAAALYEQAAAADERRVDGLLGATAALEWLAEREPAGAGRARLVERALELGQWCQRRAPGSAACHYRLAVALGQQARERAATAKDALARMVALLRKASAADPRQDDGGPHRVLALVLLRAPGWPVGPGDPEAALDEARAAVSLFPDAPPNQLALAEALRKNGRPDEARAALERAASLAGRLDPAREPEASGWRAEAEAALREARR